jgi:endonuclease/exonuclease/phosphatase family metal-dependent hydrolase
MLALPLLALFTRRWRFPLVLAAAITVVGRAAMLEGTLLTPIMGAAMTVGGGLLYTALLIRHRAQLLPYFFILALAIDQVFRALGNTLDPSWSANTLVIDTAVSAHSSVVVNYFQFQMFLSALAIILSAVNLVNERRSREFKVSPDYGLLTLGGGVGMGALLFLQLSLLALPNAIAGRANADYTTLVPFVLAATLLPIVPWVRGQARNFIALFANEWRGWLWVGIIALLLVLGTRVQFVSADLSNALSGVLSALGLSAVGRTLFNFIGAFLLVIGQFLTSLIWWWMVRPQAEKERNFSGLWIVIGVLIFALLVGFDVFTYEYAYVRNVPAEFGILNNTVIPLLRGFRGMGGLVLLLAVFLVGLPMVQAQRRIPWSGERPFWRTLLALLIVAGASSLAAFAARPPLVQGVRNVPEIRVASYNIHAGYSEFFDYNLEAMARTIEQSGANVVLLQMTEAGRMTSFGVDQPLWLGRRLGMDVRFFATNEGLQGLAVLSEVEIVFADGNLLTSEGNQTGLQRVQIRPDNGVVTIYNTWLGFLTASPERELSAQEQDQQRQLNEIYALIRLHHPDGILGRTIVGGTFNNIPDTPLLQSMRDALFEDPVEGAPLELSATLRRTTQRARLDYIWLRNLSASGWLVVDTNASDHALVVVGVLLGR